MINYRLSQHLNFWGESAIYYDIKASGLVFELVSFFTSHLKKTKVNFWPLNLGGVFILLSNFKNFHFGPLTLFSYQIASSVHLS
jgi:hypothetical protein